MKAIKSAVLTIKYLLSVFVIVAVALFGGAGAVQADILLGPFDFDSARFGNTLIESDGGAHSAEWWMNTVNANPGNPGYLTGPHFETGISNIGFTLPIPIYTIGYNTPIVNVPGPDLGVVVGRGSIDNVIMAVSTDGTSFTSNMLFGAGDAVSSGVSKNYFNGCCPLSGPFSTDLFVHSIDLSSYGIGLGSSIVAARVTGGFMGALSPQLELIRVAGFAQPIPEPASLLLLASGLAGLAAVRRSRFWA